MKDQLASDGFRNESVTIMLSANEKALFIRFCEQHAMQRSEMGRMIFREYMEKWELWHQLETFLSKKEIDKTEYSELLERWFKRFVHERQRTKRLLQLCKENGVSIPKGILVKFRKSGTGLGKGSEKKRNGNQ